MRIARYLRSGRTAVGIVVDDRVVDLEQLDPGAPADTVAVLQEGPALWQRLAAAAAGHPGTPLDRVRLLAPLRPGMFLGIGMNSPDHAEEARRAEQTPAIVELIRQATLLGKAFPNPTFAVMFNKQVTCVTGPFDPIWLPRDSDLLDYEGEMAIVIGRRIRRADEAQAAAAIAGYTITNDVSVRDWQWDTAQMWLGKSFETHGPLGPWIVTADEFDPSEAVIQTFINGEERQNGRVSDQIRSPARIVAEISQLCTLEAGDVIATGTPSGIGAATGRYMTVGDRVRVSVSGIGEIEAEVIGEPVASEEARDAAVA